MKNWIACELLLMGFYIISINNKVIFPYLFFTLYFSKYFDNEYKVYMI